MDRDYKVKLEVFEGPLDLLLYLIKKDEVDIYDVSIERITKQYLAYLETFEMLNIELAGEFIVMAGDGGAGEFLQDPQLDFVRIESDEPVDHPAIAGLFTGYADGRYSLKREHRH